MIRSLIRNSDNRVITSPDEALEISKKCLPGIYDIQLNRHGEFECLIKKDFPKIFTLMPSKEFDNLQSYLEIFLSENYLKLCKTAGIIRKTGILLHGKPGMGKSNFVNSISVNSVVTNNACVFNIDNYQKLKQFIPVIKEFRLIQDELFIIILEEIDEILEACPGMEGVIKNFLDGINSVENTLVIGTTNYIDKIPKSLIERPSRFKKVIKIEQSEETEKVKDWLAVTYKLFMPDIEQKEIEDLHDMCINKSIDEIKNKLIDYRMGITQLETSSKLGFKK